MPSRKIKGRWYADFWFDWPDGRKQRVRRKAPVNTETSARDYERAWVKDALNGSLEKKHAAKVAEDLVPLFLDYVPKFLTSSVGNKKNSLREKIAILDQYLIPRFGALKLDAVTVDEIDAYKQWLLDTRGLSKKTCNNHLIVLNALLRKAFDDGVITKRVKGKLFPLRSVRDTEFRFLSYDEAERLRQTALTGDYESYVMILLALRTGMRIGEILALRWSSVDLVSGKLLVRERLYNGVIDTPKSGKNREIPLTPDLVSALRAHRHLRGELVFCDEAGKPHTWSKVRYALQQVARRAGLVQWESLGWHELRHTFASHLVMRGAPLRTVQDLLGHATIDMTLRYAHMSPESRRESVLLLTDTEVRHDLAT